MAQRVVRPLRLTADDYFDLPDDGNRYELIAGELELSPTPSADAHQGTLANLLLAIGPHVRRNRLGWVLLAPVDVVLSAHDVLQPDLLFVRRSRADIYGGRIHGAPDLVVEVLSKSTEQYDRGRKLGRYARYGVKWYWIVDPRARTIEEFELVDGEYILRQKRSGDDAFVPAILPGLTIDLSEVWPEWVTSDEG